MAFSNDSASEVLLRQPGGKIIVRPEFRGQVTAESFHPQAWHSAAVPVACGGRGGAWFISSGLNRWVLRQYCRGGMVARFIRHFYWFSGEDSVRAFSEFRLLTQMFDAGLPVPKPVAARYSRVATFGYRAQILLERIPAATTFAEHLSGYDPDLWRRVGRLVRRFHDHGVYHADLNCHNILVVENRLYLIDFDKGEIRANDEAWKQQNLNRLKRSVDKLLNDDLESRRDRCWSQLLVGYSQNN